MYTTIARRVAIDLATFEDHSRTTNKSRSVLQIDVSCMMYPYCIIIITHRRLRLPQKHNAPPATEPQPNSTHSSFRVLNFRGWFGVQIIGCTFKHILHSTIRVFNTGIGLGLHASSAPFKECYTPGQTKEPGRIIMV